MCGRKEEISRGNSLGVRLVQPCLREFKVAIYDTADTSVDPKCIYICLCRIKTPEMWKPLYSVKWTGSPVPTVPELYKIYSITQMLIYHFRKIVYYIWWIQRH